MRQFETKAGDWMKGKQCGVQTRGDGGAAVGTDNIMFMFVERREATHGHGNFPIEENPN